ncbi:hypothetical protein [Telmatospirillum siberiense]|nr:hypothetical protein [Telmatospirillum siberiense]
MVKILALLLTILGVCTAVPAAAQCPTPTTPVDAQTEMATLLTQDGTNFGQFAWDYFTYLNNSGVLGAPLPWESQRQTADVYLPNGAAPTAWTAPPATPAAVCAAAQTIGMNPALPFHNLDSILQVDGLVANDNPAALNPLAATPRPPTPLRYLIQQGQLAFTYIVNNGIYNKNGQQAVVQAGQPLNFTANSFELKTSWIWIGGDSTLSGNLAKQGFLVVNAYYQQFDSVGNPILQNGQPVYTVGWAALTGMHIILKPQGYPAWVWITFENVQNATYVPPGPQLPIDQATATLNTQYQKTLAGTVLANYQLMGVQTTFMQGSQPTLLANSTIETAFQPMSSCITCHGTASYSANNGYFNFATPDGHGGVVYPTGQLPSLAGYVMFDYVWSLRRAHWATNP